MPTSPKPTDAEPLAPSATPDVPGPMPANARAAAAVPPRAPDQHRGEPGHPGVPLAPPGIAPESDVRVTSPSSAAPQPAHGHVNEGLGELPWGYGDQRLVSLVRDPTTLFVYWDFSQQQIEQAFHALGPARAVLKLWSARGGAGELVREAEVHLDARGWYVRELPPGSELRAELWAVGDKGARMLRSARPVRLPPSVPSDQLDAFYLRLSLDQPLREGLPGGRPLNYGGAAPSGWERRLQPRGLDGASFLGGGGGGSGKLPWAPTHVPDLDKGRK